MISLSIINYVHGCILQLIRFFFQNLINNGVKTYVHCQYFSNIYYHTILFSVISNRLKLLSCILFIISSLFICLLSIYRIHIISIFHVFKAGVCCVDTFLTSYYFRNKNVFEHSCSWKAISLTLLLDSQRRWEDIYFRCRLSKHDYQWCCFKGNFSEKETYFVNMDFFC